MLSHKLDQKFLNSSLLFHNTTNAVANPTIATTAIPIGDAIIPIVLINVPIIDIAFLIPRIIPINLLIINIAGPIAATTKPILTIISFCASDRLLNFVTKLFIKSANFLIYGANL